MFKHNKNQIFLCCAEKDIEKVNSVHDGMKARGLNVCFDREDITPKKWESQIENTINKSCYFVACLSKHALQNPIGKKHGFQDYELNKAYSIAQERSDEKFTMIPLMIEDCDLGNNFISGSYQYHIFNEFENELDRLALNMGGGSLSDPNAKDERAEDKKIIEGLMGKAAVTYYAGEYQKAIVLFEHITAIDSGSYEVCYNKGVILEILDRHEEAVSSFDHAININPDDHRALYNKGVSLQSLDRPADAIDAFNQAIKINPDDYESWYCKGNSLDSLDSSIDALGAYDKVTTLKPDHEEAWNNKGIIFGSLNRFDEEINLIWDIYNDAWIDNWGFVPMSKKEFKYVASEMKSFIQPEYCFISEVNGDPAGFSITLPDINRILKKMNVMPIMKLQ